MQNRRFWGGFEFLMKPLKSMGLANQLENGRKISSLSLKNAQFLNFLNLKYFIQLHTGCPNYYVRFYAAFTGKLLNGQA